MSWCKVIASLIVKGFDSTYFEKDFSLSLSFSLAKVSFVHFWAKQKGREREKKEKRKKKKPSKMCVDSVFNIQWTCFMIHRLDHPCDVSLMLVSPLRVQSCRLFYAFFECFCVCFWLAFIRVKNQKARIPHFFWW